MEVDGGVLVGGGEGGVAFGSRVPKVVEASAVCVHDSAAEFGPFDGLADRFSGGDIEDIPFDPIGASFGNAVEHSGAVVVEISSAESDGAVGAEGIGVEKDSGSCSGSVNGVDHVLGEESGIVAIECSRSLLDRDVESFVIDAAEEFVEEGFSVRNLVEESVCEFVLGVGPCFDFGGGDGLFEPTVGVGDGDSVVGVGLVDGFCGRVDPGLGEHSCDEEGGDH